MLGDQAWVGFYRQAPSNRCTVSSNTMVQRMALLWVGALFVVLFPGAQSDVVADEAYSKSIKPLFRDRCWACHGALQHKAGLRLDTVAAMLKGGDSGPAIVPGDSKRSLLVHRITTEDPAEHMPPLREGVSLDSEAVGWIRGWIEAGAPAPADEVPDADPRGHWAYRPPARPVVPALASGSGLGAIDALLETGRLRVGMAARPEAPRAMLIRRLFVDLVGMPPSPEEREAALGDSRPDWYERWVDRLLADPRHGERWARHWMDVWRYSDAWGLGDQLRNSQRHIHHWRDWIVESLNADVPYDEMIRLMLAADELHPGDPGRLRATGFLARNFFLFNRNQWLDETVEHVSKGFLGLTLNCAKCHDHKYDPIPQADFYRMRAFFEPYHVRMDVRPGEPDLLRDGLPRVYDRDLAKPTFRFIRGNEGSPDTNRVIQPGVPAFLSGPAPAIVPVSLPFEAFQPERNPWVLAAHVEASMARLAEATRVLAGEDSGEPLEREVRERRMEAAMAEHHAVNARADFMRGEWMAHGGDVTGGLRIAAVHAERRHAEARARLAVAEAEQRHAKAEASKKEGALKELEAARKKASEAAAKTASTVGDTERPTTLVGSAWTPTRFLDSTKDDPDPGFPSTSTGRRSALARWIADKNNPLTARVAVNHVWARHLGAPLVASVFDLGRKGTPPTNPALLDWLAAEFMEHGWSLRHLHRVIVLSAAYRMDSSTAGADVEMARDPDNEHGWRRVPMRMEAQVVRDSILMHAGQLDLARGGPSVPPGAQESSRRRSLYFYHSNNERNLLLATFDDALVKECYRRDASIVPQQALALMNARVVNEAVPSIAARIGVRSGATDEAYVREAFRTLLGFEPGEAETRASLAAMDAWRKGMPGEEPGLASRRAHEGMVWALLNHGDFVTVR